MRMKDQHHPYEMWGWRKSRRRRNKNKDEEEYMEMNEFEEKMKDIGWWRLGRRKMMRKRKRWRFEYTTKKKSWKKKEEEHKLRNKAQPCIRSVQCDLNIKVKRNSMLDIEYESLKGLNELTKIYEFMDE